LTTLGAISTIQLEHINRIGNDAAAAGGQAMGMRAFNAVAAVNELSPRWVTALDLPLIPGAGTIR
jgi:4-hydroxy-tetrahydrodipicolinate reductase